MDIFGVFGKHFMKTKKENLFGFLCSLKTNFKMFSGTVLCLYDKNMNKDG